MEGTTHPAAFKGMSSPFVSQCVHSTLSMLLTLNLMIAIIGVCSRQKELYSV